jgi:hypothetical protein
MKLVGSVCVLVVWLFLIQTSLCIYNCHHSQTCSWLSWWPFPSLPLPRHTHTHIHAYMSIPMLHEHTTEPTNFMEQLQKLNKEMYEETNHNKNKTRESGLKEFYRRSPDLLILLSIWNAFHTPPARTAIEQNAERSVSSPRCTVQRNSKQNRKANRVPIEIIS